MIENANITLLLDYFGLLAPIFLFLISIFILQNKTKYLQIYIVGFILNNPFITGLYLVTTFISLYQRYKYFNHTILQLIIGTIVGLIMGYLVYYVGNKWIKGDLKMRPDDYAPK
jgi:hypothetical protein